MRVVRPPVRPRMDAIVPLIDVVFFLLVFFMLVGRLDATAPFEVMPPRAVTGVDLPAGGHVIAIARDGSLAVDGRKIDPSDLLGKLSAMAAEVGSRPVRINAHRDSELRHVLPLITAAEMAGIRDVALVVTPKAGDG